MKSRLLSLVVSGLLLASSNLSASALRFSEATVQTGTPPSGVAPSPVVPAGGVVTVFTDRAAFDAAFPGLAVETFNGGTAPAGNFAVCDAPLSSVPGSAACGFDPGELISGVSYQDNPGPDAAALILLGVGTSLNASQALVSNTFSDAFDLVFSPPVSQAGMDLISTSAPGVGDPDTVLVTLFDASDAVIDTVPAANASGPGVFFGVSSPVPIARIRLLSNNSRAEGVDNVAFAQVAAGVQRSVPSLGLGGLTALVLGFLALAGFAWTRRQ